MNRSNTSTSPESSTTDDRLQSPPAFLDLADSAARLGGNMSDISAKVERKRLEHEKQRAIQRKIFEDQMRVLEHKQAQELLSLPYDQNAANGKDGLQHLAVSAPTTPPRVNIPLNGDTQPIMTTGRPNHVVDAESLSKAVGSANKRKSVTYAPSVNLSPDVVSTGTNVTFNRTAGAKSMPASRRTSASSNDDEISAHLHNLSLIGERPNRLSPAPASISASILTSRFGNDDGILYGAGYNAGMMLDEQLDQEMHNAMLNLPTSDDDKYSSYPKISTSSAALDLAHSSQTSQRVTIGHRSADPREKSSEWPTFNGSARVTDSLTRGDRRSVTNPAVNMGDHAKIGGAVSASATPLIPQHPQTYSRNQISRHNSPPGLLENLNATRSVPATPLGMSTGILKTPGTPQVSDTQNVNARRQFGDGSLNINDLQASLSRIPSSAPYDNTSINLTSLQPGFDEGAQPYSVENVYGLNSNLEPANYTSYAYDGVNSRQQQNPANTRGSTALYHHNGSRYGLGTPGRTNSVANDGKMNGLHGPKHKRGDVDREFNRYAGTRLEDLQGEIAALCKDQHGCRYLQKKLEEGVPEHRDMIFKETFTHFAELMTDPFGNYLCQKLLEHSTDEQRNVICESVAQDLVNISLNMHGTRAVQKMIDFLSSRRQNDLRCSAQIRSIIVALSLHVVVLIKDLNGNHVIQKCLNKLTPEDNQFIYNAVAANCVEVATHRHGCCVLQRCIDHASDHQRVQLVNEITYNALTLVQDPYGNYVVQYILDLNDSRFSDGVIRQFAGNVCALSVQKFSSNVIEKCVRVAEPSTRKMLIDELLNRTRLEKLLRDSYGNYCVQTALDYADATQRTLLVEGIRPILPLIRNTPYGKRIQNKLQREQMDPYGGYSNSQAMASIALGSQGMSVPHGANLHMHQGNPLSEIYNAQNGLYSLPGGQVSFGQSHLQPQLHSMPTQSIEGYVLQNNSQGISPSHSMSSNFPGGYFPTSNVHSSINDPYQRSTFGYGM